MSERKLLMIPGPTNVDPLVLRALSRPTLAHTDPQFVETFKARAQLLGESLTAELLLGSALTLGGVYILNRTGKKKNVKS